MDQPNPLPDLPQGPKGMAQALIESLTKDHDTRSFDPASPEDLHTLARWGKGLGLERDARMDLERLCLWLDRGAAPRFQALRQALEKPRHRAAFTEKELAAWLRRKVSPHPDRFQAVVEACRAFERSRLMKEAVRLQGCGEPWGRVVRLFWKGVGGVEHGRTYGLHACTSRFCPRCSRKKSRTRAESIEQVLELAKEWGFRPEHVRFLTLTVPNGKDISLLKRHAHEAWARLQRRRWWPRWVFGWFRGTECVTGKDGHWNLHVHVVLILWGHRLSYARMWDEWESAVGVRARVDLDRLHTVKLRQARRAGGLAAAAQYVTKYLTKAEQANVRKGPGGLAHYISATGRLRAFAMGGGASVLRRMVPTLLPNWARRLEGILEDAHLRGGMPAVRQEEINPETGEVLDVPLMSPALDDQERREAQALAGPLLQMSDTVGDPCGPKGRWRRLGEVPGRSSTVRVKDLKGGKGPTGVRALVAGGDWRLHEEREAIKGGGMRVYRLALPGRRFAWRDVAMKLQSLLAQDDSRWGRRRREAFRAWAEARMWASIPPSEGLGDPVPSQRAMDVRRVLAHGLEETEGRVGLSVRKGAWARLLGRLMAS